MPARVDSFLVPFYLLRTSTSPASSVLALLSSGQPSTSRVSSLALLAAGILEMRGSQWEARMVLVIHFGGKRL